MNEELRFALMHLLSKIRSETGETYRREIERLYVELRRLE